MEKIIIGCAVLCEGKYDKIKLSSVIDGTILTTDGFSVFNNEEKKQLIKRLCESRGLVIITDSDKAGLFIRSKLKGMLPSERVKHLYIPEIKGKEKRKTKESKDGLLGVEGMTAQTLREIILNAHIDEMFEGDTAQQKEPVTKAYLYELGLSGGKNSSEMREELCRKLRLPSGLSPNALIAALEIIGVGKQDIEGFLSGIKSENAKEGKK